jgi:hypothetical protein
MVVMVRIDDRNHKHARQLLMMMMLVWPRHLIPAEYSNGRASPINKEHVGSMTNKKAARDFPRAA